MRALPARRLDERAAEPGAAPRAPEPPVNAVLALQRAAGNRAVAGILARDPLDVLMPPQSSFSRGGRRRTIEGLRPVETAAAWLQLRDGSGLDLPDGSFLIEADERAELLPFLYERKEAVFVDFADGRRALFAAMQAAADPAERLAAIQALSAYDAPKLPELIAMRNAMKGRWQIDDTDARDAVLAAIQLQAATDAQGELLSDWKTVRDRVTKATSMPPSSEWCGMFSGSKRDVAEEATGLELTEGGGGRVAVGVNKVTPEGKAKRAAVYGVGRPSLLDLEEHTYAFKPQDKPPPPPKHAK